jgi:hypothetical protein
MLKACGQAVEKLWKSYGQAAALSTLRTAVRVFVVNRTFYVPSLATGFKHLFGFSAQPVLANLKIARLGFYTFPTRPINTNKLIKE